MQDTVYLIVNENGAKAMRKTRPDLAGGEVAVRLRLEVPDEFFHRAIPEARIVFPEDMVVTPPISIEIEGREPEVSS